MKFEKILSACLVMAALLSCTSCGLISVSQVDGVPTGERSEYGENEKTPTDAAAYAPTDPAADGRERALNDIASLGEYDFGGETVFVTVPADTGLFPEECAERADRLTAARNALVEDALSVKLVVSETTADEIYAWAKREKKAGEVIEDLLVIPSSDIAKFAADKSLADLTKVKNYSAEHAFIDAESAKGSSITGAVYGVAGAASFDADDCYAVYFNKNLLPADELYSSVKSGEWTWDKLVAYAEAADGGIATPQSQQALLDTLFCTAGGEYLTKKNGALPTAGFTSDSLKKTYSIFVELIDGGMKTSSYSAADDFIAGGTAFVVHKLSAMPKIADSTAVFGVLPLPMTEAGGKYLSPAAREYMMFAVPKEAENKEKSVAVILALNAAEKGIVHGGYVDYAFNEYLRDEQSADMLEIILEVPKTDAAYSLGAAYPEIAAATYDFVYKNRNADEKTLSKQISSAGESMKKTLEKAKAAIDKVK